MNVGTVTPRRRTCGTLAAHYRLLELDPGFRERHAQIERAAAQSQQAAPTGRANGPITIQVVVHVVWNKAAENISAAQVASQIPVLNHDFRATNGDRNRIPAVWRGLAADAGVEFKLATTDPRGRGTTGITRRRSSKTSFSVDDGVKSNATGGTDAWPSDRYLNLWVCTLEGGLLGYAQFPGGPPATDGVVILNTAFGTIGTAVAPFNLGRTTTHEIGHWLNLFHIWGDASDCSGSDQVADTPKQQLPNFGAPTFPHISCGNGPNGDMFVNYMDYVDDRAMFMFTQGQVARMTAALAGPRASFAAP